MLRADKLIQEVRIAESFIKQVDVGPQGKARVGVPKPLLHLLDVLPAAEAERRARVPERRVGASFPIGCPIGASPRPEFASTSALCLMGRPGFEPGTNGL
jgi:hypothetical protein